MFYNFKRSIPYLLYFCWRPRFPWLCCLLRQQEPRNNSNTARPAQTSAGGPRGRPRWHVVLCWSFWSASCGVTAPFLSSASPKRGWAVKWQVKTPKITGLLPAGTLEFVFNYLVDRICCKLLTNSYRLFRLQELFLNASDYVEANWNNVTRERDVIWIVVGFCAHAHYHFLHV